MNTWIIPANTKYYNVFKAYAAFKELDWRLRSTPEVGDIVYIYVARPYSCIKFKTEVVAINIPYEDSIKDEEFYTNKADASPNGSVYTRLALLEVYSHDKLDRDFLHAHGVRGNIQCPRRLQPDSIAAIGHLLSDIE